MTRITSGIFGLALVTAIGVGSAQADSPQPGERIAETRPIGNKLSVMVYRTVPYALTGDAVQRRAQPDRLSKHESRPIGNKLTVEIFHH